MPSMVSILAPSVSTARTRQEQTIDAVDHHRAGAAVAGGAAFLGAAEHQFVAQRVEQRLLRLAQELVFVAVDRRGDVMFFCHQFCLARSSACWAVRFASTPATLIRYSLVPRLSSIGRQAALAALASRSSAASSSFVPIRAAAASFTSMMVGATAPSATRAAVQVPPPSRREVDADADHRDVHLGARREALIGVARMRRPRRQEERTDDLALRQRGLARADRDLLDRHLARAIGADDPRDRAGRDHGRHAVGGGRGVAQVAADARRGP